MGLTADRDPAAMTYIPCVCVWQHAQAASVCVSPDTLARMERKINTWRITDSAYDFTD